MDTTQVKKLRRRLTMHFAVIAWLTAMLVATGSGSFFLPAFIFLVSLAAFIFVDTLEWFEVGRLGSYFLMTLATAIALSGYIYSTFYSPSEEGQLLAVASLLVYPEAVLFLQRKNLRIYEQLAVFLLLEMIVAALVNDNLVFGVLLAPIMLLWVSSLFLFARYATLVYIDPSIETPIPHLAELIYQGFKKRLRKKEERPASIKLSILPDRKVQDSRLLRRVLLSVPIGAGAIVFSAAFFYLLPRTSPGSLRKPFDLSARTGLGNSLTIGQVGRLKQDASPVMRVSLKRASTGGVYTVSEKPYLRSRVMDTYVQASNLPFINQGEWVFSGLHSYRSPPEVEYVRKIEDSGRDLVHVEFDLRRQFLPALFAVAPVYESEANQRISLRYDRFNMLMEDLITSDAPTGKSVVYEIGTSSFAKGRQIPVTRADVGGTSTRARTVASRNLLFLKAIPRGLAGVDDYRRKLMQDRGLDESRPYELASALEDHFVFSGEFAYTLDLKPPTDPSLGPIEDFVVNGRVGHCSYFASAMLFMLRQSNIPSRLVVGYHPKEYNFQGDYFAVKQRDAHAWVECLFAREALLGTDMERWLDDSESYWVRFDPTPAASDEQDEIVEQEGQTLDYAEKLWKDYVVDGQKLQGRNSLYAPVAENGKTAYDELIKQFDQLKKRVRAGKLLEQGDISFAWPLTILIICVGAMGVLLWRALVLLPRIAPRLAKRLGVGPRTGSVEQRFYARCLELLRKRGLQRQPYETPHEFTAQAAASLLGASGARPQSPQRLRPEPSVSETESPEQLSRSLETLTNFYYGQRFGEAPELSDENQTVINAALSEVERAVSK